MNSEWKIIKLGDICSIKGGKRLPKGSSLTPYRTNHPYVRIRDMYQNKYIEDNGELEFVDEDTFKIISNYIVNSGDVIIAIVGNTIGLVSLIGKSLNNASLTENCVKLINLDGCLSEYVYYYLNSDKGQNEIKSKIVGTSQPKLPIYGVKDIEIILPKLDEQKKIVEVLSALDEKIETNTLINDNLEKIAEAIFKQWFVDFEFPNENGEPYKSSGGEMIKSELGMIPKEWQVGTFRDFINTVLGGDWGKETEQGNYKKEVLCLRGADIPEIKCGKFGAPAKRFILERNYKNKKLANGDLVVEISGGSPTQSTGRITYINEGILNRYNLDFVCTNFCRAITLNDKKVMEYFYFYWSYLYDLNVFFQYENGTTGIKNFDINTFLDKHQIVIPPSYILEKYHEIVSMLLNNMQHNGLENLKLINIRDRLLPKLMSGEIRVPLEEN